MAKIVEIQLHQISKRLEDRDIHLTWTKQLVDHLAEEGYDPAFGARPLKRFIQTEVLNLLSEGILKGDIPGNCDLELTYDGKKTHYKVHSLAHT